MTPGPARLDPTCLVIIGYSAGGQDSVERLLALVHPDHPPILLVQHINAEFDRTQMEFRLRLGRLGLSEDGRHYLTAGATLKPGEVHILSAMHQATFYRAESGEPVIRISPAAPKQPFTPWIDQVFIEAARHLAPGVCGIVLSGMLDDGAQGLSAIHRAGGVVMIEPPDLAAFSSMPRRAISLVGADKVRPYEAMARVIGGMRQAKRPD